MLLPFRWFRTNSYYIFSGTSYPWAHRPIFAFCNDSKKPQSVTKRIFKPYCYLKLMWATRDFSRWQYSLTWEDCILSHFHHALYPTANLTFNMQKLKTFSNLLINVGILSRGITSLIWLTILYHHLYCKHIHGKWDGDGHHSDRYMFKRIIMRDVFTGYL